jgi:diketogulonate reductase-like aldo/keto reductase
MKDEAIDQNIAPITATTKAERMDEYIAAVSLKLSRAELECLAVMDDRGKMGRWILRKHCWQSENFHHEG